MAMKWKEIVCPIKYFGRSRSGRGAVGLGTRGAGHSFPTIVFGPVRQTHRLRHRRPLIRHVVARRVKYTRTPVLPNTPVLTPVLSYIRIYKHVHAMLAT